MCEIYRDISGFRSLAILEHGVALGPQDPNCKGSRKKSSSTSGPTPKALKRTLTTLFPLKDPYFLPSILKTMLKNYGFANLQHDLI